MRAPWNAMRDATRRMRRARPHPHRTAREWPLRAVPEQTRRTLAAQPAVTALLIALTALTAGSLALADAAMRQDAIDQQTRLETAGRYVMRAQARTERGEGLIPAAVCHGLNLADGVRAAAGFVDGERGNVPVTLPKAPGEQLSMRTAVGDVAGMLDPSGPPRFDEGFYIDRTLAADLGIGDGMRVELVTDASRGTSDGEGERTVATAHVLDLSARGFDQSRSIIAIGPPTGTVGECLVEMEPGAWGTDDATDAGSETARNFVASALDDGRTITSVTPFLDAATLDATPLERLRTRISRHFWLVSGLACAGLTLAPMLFRRHEFALYRSVGAGANPVALIHAAVCAIMLCAGHLSGWLWAELAFRWMRHAPPAEPWTTPAAAGASLLLASALVTAACALLARGDMAAYIQRRL
ncbi:hypothetical protein G1C96_0343 [Bifidobacterium sp. DSM 109958]|uniref:ABC transporter permease n=1 Tax=Bifidobacterium moraviense TaxID=2675323 RepID=A0A7Y0HWZ8_9BIFI|nr:hypothetical protein [Bifidobacterium sp. DSM 109958]NMM99765.1 hypothetical protein [Bifidobacterium sp. DSM 109958]